MQADNVGSARKVLENLDLALDLLFLDRLQDLDDALVVVDRVDALEYFRVLGKSESWRLAAAPRSLRVVKVRVEVGTELRLNQEELRRGVLPALC